MLDSRRIDTLGAGDTPLSLPAARAGYYTPASVPRTLERWLSSARRWDIEYGGYLSNHIAHNWVVLGATGASDERMAWWEDLYLGRLPDAPRRAHGALPPPRSRPADLEPLGDDNWLAHLRRTPENFQAYRELFDARIARLGIAETVRCYLPPLLPGLAGRALHAVIHAGWGVEATSPSMAADGLAYMACAYQPLGHDPLRRRERSPLWVSGPSNVIARSAGYLAAASDRDLSTVALRASETPAYRAHDSGSFQHRMMTFDDPVLPLARSLADAGPLSLPDGGDGLVDAVEDACAVMAAAVVASRSEFFVVHGLTSLHAVLALAAHADPVARRDALAYWWRAAMATYVCQGLPELSACMRIVADWSAKRERDPAPSARTPREVMWWAVNLERATESFDEHVPKAVFALDRWASWGVLSRPTLDLLADAARQLVRPARPGNVADNLWFSRHFEAAVDV